MLLGDALITVLSREATEKISQQTSAFSARALSS